MAATPPAVPAWRIDIAAKTVFNAGIAAEACRQAGLPYFVALALLEKESGGRNIYGHDKGGVNTLPSGVNLDVTDINFMDFIVRVMNGEKSNGVGPCQITYAGELKNGHRDGGYFREMAEQRLLPWVPLHNMIFGFKALAKHYEATRSWSVAGARYNGGTRPNTTALAYGADLEKRQLAWRKALKI